MTDGLLMAAGPAAVGGLVYAGWGHAVGVLRDTGGATAVALRGEMSAAGMDPAPLPAYLLAWRGLALAFAVAGLALDMWPVGFTLAAIAWHAAPWWVRGRVTACRRTVGDQLAGAARNLAGQVRVGLPLSEALAAVSRDAPAPLGTHLRRAAGQVARGDDTRSALAALRDRVKVDAVSALAVAVQVAEERGGRLADVLDRIAQSAEEAARVERKRQADTAAGRLMVALMGAFPFAFLVFLHTLDAELTTTMFTTRVGQYVLSVVCVLVYVSVRWATNILAASDLNR